MRVGSQYFPGFQSSCALPVQADLDVVGGIPIDEERRCGVRARGLYGAGSANQVLAELAFKVRMGAEAGLDLNHAVGDLELVAFRQMHRPGGV